LIEDFDFASSRLVGCVVLSDKDLEEIFVANYLVNGGLQLRTVHDLISSPRAFAAGRREYCFTLLRTSAARSLAWPRYFDEDLWTS
jgi:hypothetical protein